MVQNQRSVPVDSSRKACQDVQIPEHMQTNLQSTRAESPNFAEGMQRHEDHLEAKAGNAQDIPYHPRIASRSENALPPDTHTYVRVPRVQPQSNKRHITLDACGASSPRRLRRFTVRTPAHANFEAQAARSPPRCWLRCIVKKRRCPRQLYCLLKLVALELRDSLILVAVWHLRHLRYLPPEATRRDLASEASRRLPCKRARVLFFQH
mmetsp:Transcript_41028/g.95377  ORF Transcript_41028/g.95377 Transcript_41028/m.95377 type:complete len:208 (+) Transcript_41028:453-1076(+)